VIAPAKTGRDKSSNTAVIKTDQTNKGVALNLIPSIRILKIVVIKLIAPRIDLIPARCRLKIVKSTERAECAKISDKGG
jgi:hypothetical protein